MTKVICKTIRPLLMVGFLSLLSGCDHINQWMNQEEVVLPESPPLETQELSSVAATCRKSVEGLEKRSAYVPKERRSEFQSVVGIASDNCSELEETLMRLKQASHQKEAFIQNLQHAESIIVQRAQKKSPIKEVDLSDFSEFEADDSAEMDLKPLQ